MCVCVCVSVSVHVRACHLFSPQRWPICRPPPLFSLSLSLFVHCREVNEIVTLLNNATTLAADLQQEVNNSSDCDTNANTMQICSDINDALVVRWGGGKGEVMMVLGSSARVEK